MKHALPFSLVSTSIVLAVFLLTLSTASAQTTTQLRPAAREAIKNEQPARPPSQPENFERKEIEMRAMETKMRDDAMKEVESEEMHTDDSLEAKPRTFLEKAQATLKEKRQRENAEIRINEDAQRKDNFSRGEEPRDAVLKKQKEDRTVKFLSNIKNKMDAAISRLEILAERIESRIDKFEARGVDMTEARRLLETAKESIAQAVENITTAFEEAREVLALDLTRDAFGGVVSELSKAKENLRAAHSVLIQVVRTMKNSISNEETPEDTNVEKDAPDSNSLENN
ncbi:MAG: hypothetical protein WD509_01470 [Candidatus Paceibacterota bacterium]